MFRAPLPEGAPRMARRPLSGKSKATSTRRRTMGRRLPTARVPVRVRTLTASLLLLLATSVIGQTINQRDAARRARFLHDANLDAETGSGAVSLAPATEAPAAFDNLTNGFDPQ